MKKTKSNKSMRRISKKNNTTSKNPYFWKMTPRAARITVPGKSPSIWG